MAWRGLLALLGVSVAVLLAGKEYDYFNPPKWALFWGSISVALAGAIEGFFGVLATRREGQRGELEARTQKTIFDARTQRNVSEGSPTIAPRALR